MKMKVLVLLLLLSVCSSLALAWQTDTGSGSGSGRPYHYGEESFRHWTRSRQGRFRVLERFTHELLEDAVGNYRVTELEAAPRAFLQPSHYDADEVMFVKEGEGVVVLLRGGRRESFCVREGDVMVIPAGAVVYSANTHHSEWLRVVMLLSPVSTSGRFEVCLACIPTRAFNLWHAKRADETSFRALIGRSSSPSEARARNRSSASSATTLSRRRSTYACASSSSRPGFFSSSSIFL
jgi:mannose-6-phosphate isomerase-like protein (cupin superfamily)